MSSIMDLPDMVLRKIFNYVPDNSKDNLFRVSHRLRHLIDNSYGRVLILGVPSASMRTNLPTYEWVSQKGFEAIRLHGVRHCRVGKLLDPAIASTGLCHLFYTLRDVLVNANQPLYFKHPNLLRKLQLDGRISPHYFEALTTGVHNLTSLSLHWKALSSLNPGVLDPLYFPNLMTLDVWGGHDIKENAKVNFEKLCNFVESLSVLMKNVFLSLRVFRMDLPNQPRILMLLTALVIAFLNRHAETLMIFKLELIPMSVFWDGHGDQDNSEQLNKCSNELYHKMQDLSTNLRLKTLELATCETNDDEISYLNIWTILAMGLQSLKEFQGAGFPVRQDVAKQIILNNTSSLNLIHVCIPLMDFGIWKPVDCSIFSNCHALTQLCIEASEHSKRNKRSPGIINVNALPGSLKTLSIRKIPVHTTSLELIFVNMEHLKNLSLAGIDNTIEFGMPVDLLNRVLNIKKLNTLAISCDSIRGEEEQTVSFSEIFIKICSKANEFLLDDCEDYLTIRKDDILEVRLNDSGSYEVLNPL